MMLTQSGRTMIRPARERSPLGGDGPVTPHGRRVPRSCGVKDDEAGLDLTMGPACWHRTVATRRVAEQRVRDPKVAVGSRRVIWKGTRGPLGGSRPTTHPRVMPGQS